MIPSAWLVVPEQSSLKKLAPCLPTLGTHVATVAIICRLVSIQMPGMSVGVCSGRGTMKGPRKAKEGRSRLRLGTAIQVTSASTEMRFGHPCTRQPWCKSPPPLPHIHRPWYPRMAECYSLQHLSKKTTKTYNSNVKTCTETRACSSALCSPVKRNSHSNR